MAGTEQTYKPGDYILSFVGIIGTSGVTKNITNLVMELNIYQSIESSMMTGDIVVTDNAGLAEELPFIGQERLMFNLRTPGRGTGNALNFDQYHAVISSVSDRFSSTDSTHVYRLEWVTAETFTNARTKVSQSFKGELSSMVEEIVRDENYLNSKKPLHIEETRDIKTFVSPNLRPYQTIKHLAEQAISKEDGHSGYLFYENARGYHFRSFESLMGKSLTGTLTPTSKVLKLQPSDHNDSKPESRTDSIIELRLVNSMDTLTGTRAGLFGSTLLYHDVFNKNVMKKEFNYFMDSPMTSVNTNQNRWTVGTIASDSTMFGKTFGDFPESRVYLHTTSSDNLHTDGIDNNADEWLQTSASRYYEQDYFQLQVVLYGDTSLCAGDIVQLVIPSNMPKTKGDGPAAYDNIMSGRYLIADLKHSVNPAKGLHGMTLRLIKDSVQEKYPVQDLDFGVPPDGGTISLSSGDYKTPDEVNSLQSKL